MLCRFLHQVRDHPLYHLIRARILKQQGESAEALTTLQMAMALPGVKTSGEEQLRIRDVCINGNDSDY